MFQLDDREERLLIDISTVSTVWVSSNIKKKISLRFLKANKNTTSLLYNLDVYFLSKPSRYLNDGT